MDQKLVLYVGLDPKPLFLLEQDRVFSVVAVGHIPELMYKGVNVVNLLFYCTYLLRKKNFLRHLELTLSVACRLLGPLTTGVFSRYKKYLLLLAVKGYKVIDVYDASRAVGEIQSNQIDVCVMNGWGMLDKDVVNAPIMGSVNIHPSELPKYRGALPTLWSLKNHDSASAVSYIIANAKADAGMLIGQHKFIIESGDDALSVEQKIDDVVRRTFLQDLKGYLSGAVKPWAQDESIASSTGKYEQYRCIDPANEKVLDVYNKIKLYPYLEYGTYCYFLLNPKRKFFVRNVASRGANVVGDESAVIVRNYFHIYLNTIDGHLKMRLFLDFSIIDSLRLIFFVKNNPLLS